MMTCLLRASEEPMAQMEVRTPVHTSCILATFVCGRSAGLPVQSITPIRLTRSTPVTSALSSAKIPSAVDAAMDRQVPTNGKVKPGISLANGEVKVKDTVMTDSKDGLTNGAALAKRKALTRPSYADAESSDEDLPLVRESLRWSKEGPRRILTDY